jgi:hypothetical protein
MASCYSKLLFGTVIAVRVNITDICITREKDQKLKYNWLMYFFNVQDLLLLILRYIVFIDVRRESSVPCIIVFRFKSKAGIFCILVISIISYFQSLFKVKLNQN